MNNLFLDSKDALKRLSSKDNIAKDVELKPIILARTSTKEYMDSFFTKNKEKSLTKE